MGSVRGTYPFGAPLVSVEQRDRTPKPVFVLGVYASAVHATWLDERGRVLIRALAVASEPSIFWDGAGAAEIVGAIRAPAGAGRLKPADPSLNGPSGRCLDERFLAPLGITRNKAWLCDLVPHTCLNPAQAAALEREYEPRRVTLGLPLVDIPAVPTQFADARRRGEIQEEIELARPTVIVLLGDQPIRHFLAHYHARWRTLAEITDDGATYGELRNVTIAGRTYDVLALAHPCQVAGLGSHSPRWRAQHEAWMKRPTLLR